jgi:uncharacterized protein YqfA (UPF0365 family)
MADTKKKNKETLDTAHEIDITEAAVDAAEQAGAVIAEKRTTSPVAVAKAGKRSAKAVAETEEKAAKEEKKACRSVGNLGEQAETAGEACPEQAGKARQEIP